MNFHRLINPYRLANTYIIPVVENKVVLIDFGNYDLDTFCSQLIENKWEIAGVFLTHEHSDHCNGLDALYKKYPFTLYCSEMCDKNMRISRQNFSIYIEDMPTIELKLPSTVVKDGEVISIYGTDFCVMETPGHSPGGICIFVDDIVFTGDTILNGIKTPLSFPHSNRKDYRESIEKLKEELKKGMIICPGHDEPFTFKDFDSLEY